jgi:FAD/FMN-containing dehydrogenase
MSDDLVYRLRKRAEIRRQISDRKSVQEGKPDRIADLLEEAAEALAESANSTTNFVEPKALAQPEQEAFTLDRGCWERGCCAYDTRDGDGVIVYVDAVNMSQERVDETEKREHEWVGLTDEEMNELWVEYHGDSCIADGRIPEYEKAIEAKLKEKNT